MFFDLFYEMADFLFTQIVYFKKLTAIKQLVELLKVEPEQVEMPESTPRDLIKLVITKTYKITKTFTDNHYISF
jgi:hypothetical protein